MLEAEREPLVLRTLPGREAAAAGEAWRWLEDRIGGGRLACSWAWTGVWLDHYGSVVPHSFVLATRAGLPCGIALITRGVGRSGAVRIRRVYIGTAGEPKGESVNVEYNGVLVARADRDAFAAAFVREIAGDPLWDELVLNGFAPEEAEPFLRALPALEPRPAPSPFLDLRPVLEDGHDPLALLPAGTRRRVQQSLRRFGPLDCQWARTADEALDILAELVTLHQRRWNAIGKPGAFASERFNSFHRELVARLVPVGAVVLFRARTASGMTVGCLYGFIERRRLLFYQSGLAAFNDNRLRPGMVTHTLCMRAAAEHAVLEYDFLPSDSRYKRELSNGARELVWATARRRHLRSRLIDSQRWLKRTVMAR